MSLIRWEPFRNIDDFFERLGPANFGRWPKLFETGGALEWAPAADISESETEYLVKADLPGVKREDVRAGDAIKARCHQLRDGANGCLLGFITPMHGDATRGDGIEREWD